MKWSGLILVLSLALTGCATREAVFMPAATQSADQPFAVSGRLSVNLDGKGHVANFDWRHQPERDQLAINSPLGNTVAEVIRDAGGVTLLADGKAWQAADVESLTEKTLGWPLPLSGLAWWIRGMPVPGEASEVRPDGELLQQGWRIRFVREAESGERYPKRVDLARDGLTVRVVTRDWR